MAVQSFSELTLNNLSFNDLIHFQQRQRSKKREREYRKKGNELNLRVLWSDGDFQLLETQVGSQKSGLIAET